MSRVASRITTKDIRKNLFATFDRLQNSSELPHDKIGADVRLQTLVDVSGSVAAARGRLEKIRHLSEFLRRVPADEIEIAIAFLSGAPRQGRIGLGWSSISSLDDLDADALADRPQSNVSLKFEPTRLEAPLELRAVDAIFSQIQQTAGAGSSRARGQLLKTLLVRSSATERDFLLRILSGELRQGALEGILLEAVARAAGVPAATIRQAAMTVGSLRTAAKVALTEGSTGLVAFALQLFRPVKPMLAETAASVADALRDLGEAAFEFKLDGARIQVHKGGNEIKVFSRNLRDVTAAVPEVVEAMRPLAARELILEGEVIALQTDGRPYPFQETMRRFTRKLDVNHLRDQLPLTPVLFDCLYVDGQPLLDEPQSSRFARLLAIAPHLAVPHLVTNQLEDAEGFLAESVRRGHEGVMAKATNGPYVAGNRGRSWLKVKVVRTLDLVVLAAEWGHGRRRGWFSNLHLGARATHGDGFVMLGKTFKGMTDEMLEWQTHALLALEERREGPVVYVRPQLVVEVAFNDIQVSPQYPGKLALRFARVKGYRPDKTTAEADTLAAVQKIYRDMTGRDAPGESTSYRRLN